MRRAVLSILIALFCVLHADAAGVLLLGQVNPNPAYYVNALTGNDSNNGTAPATPWLTLHKVNNSVFAAYSSIYLSGVFSGGDNGLIITTTVAPSGNINITSYGTAPATINSGNSVACVSATNVPVVTINGIICTGGGSASNTTNGIEVLSTGASMLAGPTIKNVTVSGYGINLIEVGNPSRSGGGFSTVNILNNSTHDGTENVGSFPDASCITVIVAGVVNISNNTTYNCLGTAGEQSSGNGITYFEVSGGTIAYNLVHDFGANNTDPGGTCGIWGATNNGITNEFNEVYNGSGSGGALGCGIDMDGATTNSFTQYNYTHNNTGSGYLVDQYTGAPSAWNSNVVRFNISQNDAYGLMIADNSGEAMTGCAIYNNTVYGNGASGSAVYQPSNMTGTADCNLSNNILYELGGSSVLVNLAHPSSVVFTGNDYFGVGTYSYNGTGYSTFSAWQAASGQEKIGGANVGLTSEPRLVVYGGGGTIGGYIPANLNEYELQGGSPMLGAGINLVTQYGYNIGSQDFYGASISALSLPVGAGQQVAWSGASSASCSQATAFLGRASSPPTATQEQYNALICGLVADGAWAELDALYKLAADSATDAKLNLVSSSYGLTPQGTITFAANAGYTGDGSTGYLTTGYTPSTAAGQMTQNSADLGIYVTSSSTTDNDVALGTGDVSGNNLYIAPLDNLTSHFGSAYLNDASGHFPQSVTNVEGLWLADRASSVSAGVSVFVDAVSQTLTGTAASSALPADPIFIGAINNAGTPVAFFGEQISYAFWGSSLTAPQIVLASYRINADAIALGINAF